MNKFKASFRFYEKAAPYPGFCLRCGTGERLWQLGEIRGTTMAAYYCDPCLVETAEYSGMVQKHVYENETTELKNKVNELEAQLGAAPKLLKELSENVNSILGEFVTTLAGVASSSSTAGPKGNKANSGGAKAKSGSATEAGQGKVEGTESGSEPAGE